MSAFRLETEFTPKGDQPEAIDQLVAGVERGDPHQVLACPSNRVAAADVLDLRERDDLAGTG